MLRRSTAAVVVLLFALLQGAGAKRRRSLSALAPAERKTHSTPVGSFAARAPAVRRTRAQLAPLALLLLKGAKDLGADAVAIGPESVTYQLFNRLDVDNNGKISEPEMMVWIREKFDEESQLEYSAIFSQADIDDDARLSLPEFEFAGFLFNEAISDTTLERHAENLPPAFREDIAAMFDGLRKQSPGQVVMQDFKAGLEEMLRSKYNHEFQEGEWTYFEDLYERSDIIVDGKLNMNELDYFEFLVDDFLVRAAAEMHIRRQGRPEADRHSQRLMEVFMREFDADSSGTLTEAEVVRGVRRMFGDEAAAAETAKASAAQLQRGEALAKTVHEKFAECDVDRDGILDEDEIPSLVDIFKVFAKSI